MSRFSRRVWGFVVAVVAVECAIQAMTFRFDYSPARDRAWFQWQARPTSDTEAAWKAALAETGRREQKVRYEFAGLATLAAIGAGLLFFRRGPKDEVVSLFRD